jgi:hypothetical protein
MNVLGMLEGKDFVVEKLTDQLTSLRMTVRSW